MRRVVSAHDELEFEAAKNEPDCHPPLTVPDGQSEQLLVPGTQDCELEVLSDAKFPKSHPEVMRDVEEVKV